MSGSVCPVQRNAWGQRFLVIVVVLAAGSGLWRSVAEQSWTNDEPYHLLAGLEMHRLGTNTLNYEHPPLVKWLAALPLRGHIEMPDEPIRLSEVRPTWHLLFDDPTTTHQRILLSRLPLVLVFVLPLLAACYMLGKAYYGRSGGLVLAAAVALSFSTLPYLPLAQTDTAVAAGWLATTLLAVRYAQRPGVGLALSVGLAFGWALASKMSAPLLAPTVIVALVLAAPARRWRVVLDTAMAFGVALAILLASYALANPRYDSQLGRQAITDYAEGRGTLVVGDRLQPHRDKLLAIERFSPALAQYLTGALGIRAQNDLGIYASWAFGELDSRGRWWYFPAVMVIKLPLTLLLATLMAVLAAWMARRRRGLDPASRAFWLRPTVLLPTVTVAVYLAVAASSSYNLGIRYLLPILPLLMLPAVGWIVTDYRRTSILVALLAFESMVLAPSWMAATNTWWLGPWNPTRTSLSASNLTYKQSYIELARVAEQRALEPLTVFYPDANAREIHAYLPTARAFRPGQEITAGWYAVGLHAEQLLPSIEEAGPERLYGYDNYRRVADGWYPPLRTIQTGDDHGIVAGSFRLYRHQ